jgi:hypothetical protein
MTFPPEIDLLLVVPQDKPAALIEQLRPSVASSRFRTTKLAQFDHAFVSKRSSLRNWRDADL